MLYQGSLTYCFSSHAPQIALDCDGALWTWGCNDDYTLGRIDKKDEGVPRKVTAMTEEIIEISAGACHSAVLTKGGDVYTWGTYKDSNGHIGFKIGNVSFARHICNRIHARTRTRTCAPFWCIRLMSGFCH
jgi:alpha-tubulin suppressor-like RCC1 family protein